MALSVPKSGLAAMLKDGAQVHVHGFIASRMHVKFDGPIVVNACCNYCSCYIV